MTNFHSPNHLVFNLKPTRCYLLKIDGGYLLIDTSFPNYYEEFCNELHKHGIELTDIKYLLLTHHHDDHAGFAEKLKEVSGCRLIVHEKAIVALAKGEYFSKNHPLNGGIKMVMFFFNKFKKRDFKIQPVIVDENDIVIHDETDATTLPAIGLDGKLLHTVGHTEDSLTLILSNGNTYPGDICMNSFNIFGTHHRPIFLSDMKLVLESWNKIIDNGAKFIFPSHGKPFSVEELIKSRNRYQRKNCS